MRLKQISKWRTAAENAALVVDFVVTVTDGASVARFCNRPDEFEVDDDDGDEVAFLPGLKTDLASIEIAADPRHPANAMPVLPPLRFESDVLSEMFGQDNTFPRNVSAFSVEIALACDSLSWDDRIVFISDARVDPTSVEHMSDGTVAFNLRDPLSVGRVLLPWDVIDTAEMPAAWLAEVDGEVRIQTNLNGVPFPVHYGEIFRMQPLKIYDDGGATNGNNAQPIRRYIIAAGRVSGANATLHRASSTIPIGFIVAPATKSEYSDLTKAIQTIETQDGFLFSYVETDGSVVPAGETNGEEDPTLSPPKEVRAISFDATDGEEATFGSVVRDLIQRWSDIELDAELIASFSNVVHEFRSFSVSVTLDGEGNDRATVAEILDERFAGKFPLGISRAGGGLRLVPFFHVMLPPGAGYKMPSVELSVGDECWLERSIRETGEIFNAFEVRYKMRGDDQSWDAQPLLLNPDTDFDAAKSAGLYGRREAPVVELVDVIDGATAGAILSYLKAVHLQPWYEANLSLPLDHSWLMPGDKVRLHYSEESRISDACTREKTSLLSDFSNSWRDAIVSAVRPGRVRFGVTVIF